MYLGERKVLIKFSRFKICTTEITAMMHVVVHKVKKSNFFLSAGVVIFKKFPGRAKKVLKNHLNLKIRRKVFPFNRDSPFKFIPQRYLHISSLFPV